MKTSAKALSIREICSPIRHGSMKILARMDNRIYRGWKHQRVLEILHFWSFYFRVSGNFCITTNLENIFYVSLFMEKYPFIIQSIRILIRCSQNVVDWLNSAFLPGIESFSERLLELVTGNNKHGSSVKSESKRILFDVLVYCWDNSLFPSLSRWFEAFWAGKLENFW